MVVIWSDEFSLCRSVENCVLTALDQSFVWFSLLDMSFFLGVFSANVSIGLHCYEIAEPTENLALYYFTEGASVLT